MTMLENAFDPIEIMRLIHKPRVPLIIIKHPTLMRYGVLADTEAARQLLQQQKIIAMLPAVYPEYLGDLTFTATHGVRFPYIVGEMANGIATADMVIAAHQAGLLGSFGAAGMMPDKIVEALHKIRAALGDNAHNWAANLIYNSNEPEVEKKTVELFLDFQVRHVSSSAYMTLSPHIVRYAFSGIHLDATGNIKRQNHVLAKVSHPEVAKHFLMPPPEKLLTELVAERWLTADEAALAANLPVAEDLTAEADSGGHTDNRPLTVLFPVLKELSLNIQKKYQYPTATRIGAAGGLGTPQALVAAFAMGAAYVLTGSINQAAKEAGICEAAKQLLANADMTDVEMAPAADMFELGVKLQVLKRGSLFSRRASKLYQYYKNYKSIEDIPLQETQFLEKDIFRESLDVVWKNTEDFFNARDPKQITIAARDPKYKMALIFRAYLGQASRWPMVGDAARVNDYQLWCGPAMGSFNAWVKNTFLEDISQRDVKQIAYNLLEGAAVLTRAQQLRSFGVLVPEKAFHFSVKKYE